jgi:probable phosphoglycerate mutase
MKLVAYFVRHGMTALNADNKFDGPMDTDLDESGKTQAEVIKGFLKDRPTGIMVHSTKKRTRQTLEPLAEEKGRTPSLMEGLDPLDTGDFAGTPKTKESLDEMKWYRKHPYETIPGGEKVREFRKRVDSSIMKVLEKGSESGKPVVACVHGSVIRELSRLLHRDYNKARVDPGGVIAVYKLSHSYEAVPLLNEDKKKAEEVQPGS